MANLARDVGPLDQALAKALQGANSLTNRYTLLLYALERSRNAAAFSCEKNRLTGPQFDRPERELADRRNPEKPHIIPYSHLIAAYGLEFTSRVSSTEANNIGNITYISGVQNSLGGLSDSFAELEDEGENLAPHFINEHALRAYGATRKAIESAMPDPKEVKQLYEEWIKGRQVELVAVSSGGLVNWNTHGRPIRLSVSRSRVLSLCGPSSATRGNRISYGACSCPIRSRTSC